MKSIINFFETLNLKLIHTNLEFETNDEQITVSEGKDCYYFLFSKVESKFRSNLCSEILFLNESQHDLKLFKSDTELGKYFQEKFKTAKSDKEVEKYFQENLKISETNENYTKNNYEEFIIKLENHLLKSNNLNKILLMFKIEEKLPEKFVKIVKKI